MANLRRDLVLEYKTGERDEDLVKVILANKPGQRYTFGSEYPGERKGEEFLFSRGYKRGVVNPTHCVISVDEQGLFWIQNDTSHAKGRATRTSVYNTFVNSERVKGVEKRLLKSGDIVSLGYPQTRWTGAGHGRPRHPVYSVTERTTLSSGPQTELRRKGPSHPMDYVKGRIAQYWPNIEDAKIEDELKRKDGYVESPLINNLILSKIMTYLPVPDLLSSRLVSKLWKEEASKVLEKKGQVSFHFGIDYLNPQHSTKVSRYLHEMNGLKLRNLHIRLKPTTTTQSEFLVQDPLLFSPGEPGEKMLDDLRKLLNSSHKFSTLFLQGDVKKESDFLLFSLLMQKLGGKLVELKFQGGLVFLPEVLPPFPLMSNLKRLTHKDSRYDGNATATEEKWIAHLVPLFSKNLEHFRVWGCSSDIGSYSFLQEFTKSEMPKLKGVRFQCATSPENLSLLLELKTPLTSLSVKHYKYPPEAMEEEEEDLLEKLLFKNASSLQSLGVTVRSPNNEILDVKFPHMPNLVELDLIFQSAMRVRWGENGLLLNYKEHLPSLRNLKIVFFYRNAVAETETDTVLNSFFPGTGDNGKDNDKDKNSLVRCETMEELWVALLPDWTESPNEHQEDAPAQKDFFHPRVHKIRKMFPKAWNMTFFQQGVGLHYELQSKRKSK